jgi:MFS family permease
VLVATILGSSMAFIDGTVVNVALPAVQASFHASVVDVQWVVESYGLFLGALILVGGSLGDLFGRRLIFVTGIAIFAVASALCGAALNIHQLIIARSIQGVGAALLMPGSLAIPLAVTVIAISLWRIPESRIVGAGRVDWSGALLATVGLGGLVAGFMESVNLGWRNPLVCGSLILGVACLITLVVVEGNVTSPMLPLALFESRSFTGANLLTLFLYAATGIFFFLFPLNLIQVQNYSATAAGAALLPFILLMFILSLWSGGVVARYGPRIPLIAGPLIVSIGFALFAVPSLGESYWRTFFPAILVLGFGTSVTVAPLTTVVMSSVDLDRVGSASGINNAVARIAGVLAIAMFGIVMVKVFGSELNHRLAHLSLSPPILQELHSDEIKLAGLQVPLDLNPSTSAEIKESVNEAFEFGFRIIMLACAGLSLASAATG